MGSRFAATLILLALLVQLTPISVLNEQTEVDFSSPNSMADVPALRVGDKWIYSGTFNPTKMIEEAGVSASVGEIQGDSTMEIISFSERMVDNVSTLVLTSRASADFDKSGVELDGYTGNVRIKYTLTEVRRVSDLASIQNDLDLEVVFVPYGIGSLTQDIADITITTTYAPAAEIHDFPIRLGDRWTTHTTSYQSWSGSSDYITPFPPPTTDTEPTTYEVTSIGKPVDSRGRTIGYSGCDDSFEIITTDRNGTQTGYDWYCPAARGMAWMHTEDDIGLVIDFRLKQYIPVNSAGVDINSNPGTRNEAIKIETSRSLTALNSPLEAWINLTTMTGGGHQIEFRYDSQGLTQTITTAANGSAWIKFDVGSTSDYSFTSTDYSSHGLIAKFGGEIQAITITLDDNIVGLDLIAATDRTSITRERGDTNTTLNANSGYNVLPDDNLTIEIKVLNLGITTTSPTIVTINHPNGTSIDKPLPALELWQEHSIELYWTVPENTSVGNKTLSWIADPNLINSADANAGNNLGQIDLFVGRLPELHVNNSTGLTRQEILIDASESSDPDLGEVWCKLKIHDENSDGKFWTRVFSKDCKYGYSWNDDGEYEVEITLIDDEGDEVNLTHIVEVINRAPLIEVRSARDMVKVEHPVTLTAYVSDNDSEDSWPGLVDVYWPGVNCDEGYWTRVCTTTSNSEGLQMFTAVATDDDGATSSSDIIIDFTNIAPHGIQISMWNETDEVIRPDSQLTWEIEEDKVVWLTSLAQDSLDDVESLQHLWHPDDTRPEWSESISGRTSKIEASWIQSGLHTISLEVLDTEGESSGIIERYVNVVNVPPVVNDLGKQFPLAEGQNISLSGTAYDTPSDNDSLVVCWDIDPGSDSDDFGSADDDCDVLGEDITISWTRSGIHPLIFHATDDDGARTSKTIEIEVINLPPRIKIAPLPEIIEGDVVKLDATGTIDSDSDLKVLTVVWDLDISHDSDGDGIRDNDADLVGLEVDHVFTKPGTQRLKAWAWDEDPQLPSNLTFEITVLEKDKSAIESVGEMLVGEDANPFVQLGSLALLILLIAKLGKRSKESKGWSDEGHDDLIARRPMRRPPNELFSKGYEVESGPPIPDEGLPPGWTEEQWKYYGQQWLDAAVNPHDD